MERYLRYIDRTNEILGKAVMYLIPLLCLQMLFEVISRYGFHSPTKWGFETSVFLMGIFALLGGGYGVLHKSHVTLDVLYGRLSERGKTILDIATFPLFAIFAFMLVWWAARWAWSSTLILERSTTVWAPYTFWFKWMIPIGGFFLVLQRLAKLARDIRLLASGKSGGKE